MPCCTAYCVLRSVLYCTVETSLEEVPGPCTCCTGTPYNTAIPVQQYSNTVRPYGVLYANKEDGFLTTIMRTNTVLLGRTPYSPPKHSVCHFSHRSFTGDHASQLPVDGSSQGDHPLQLPRVDDYFHEAMGGLSRYVPRAVLTDLEPQQWMRFAVDHAAVSSARDVLQYGNAPRVQDPRKEYPGRIVVS
jgi:hypothetical protein